MPAKVRIPSRNKPKMLEKHVVEAVTEFMRIDGWRPIKMEPLSKWGKGSGELGMPDYLFLRYKYADVPTNWPWVTLCEHFWIEFKRPGAKPKPHQVSWHVTEQANGALVRTVDDFDAFRRWYMASGLARKVR